MAMDVSVSLPPELQQATQAMVSTAVNKAIQEALNKNSFRPYMTQQESCKYLHVAPSTLNRWIKDYNLPIVQIEGVKRYSRTSLDEFMKRIEK